MSICQKKIDKIFLKFSFIVALRVHFLLQISILSVKGIRKHVAHIRSWRTYTNTCPSHTLKGSANFFGRLTFFRKNGNIKEFSRSVFFYKSALIRVPYINNLGCLITDLFIKLFRVGGY